MNCGHAKIVLISAFKGTRVTTQPPPTRSSFGSRILLCFFPDKFVIFSDFRSSLCFSIFQNSFSLLRLTYVATKVSAASVITSASSPDVPSRPVPRTVGHSLKSQLNARLRKKSNQNDSLHGHSPANPIATSVSPFAVLLQHSNVTRFTSCRSA